MTRAVPDWRHPSGPVAIPEDGAAHLWDIVPSHDDAAGLTAVERSRYDGITCEETKIGYASSQGGLRRIAEIYLNRPPGSITIGRLEHGKPFISGAPEFNLSHTAGKILVVFAREAVGLDIESADRRVNAQELAEKFFSGPECAYLASLDAGSRNTAFLRYWVCKEAMVKLSGEGIFRGLRDVRVNLSDGEYSEGIYHGRRVWIREIQPAAGLIGAIASWTPFAVKGFFRV